MRSCAPGDRGERILLAVWPMQKTPAFSEPSGGQMHRRIMIWTTLAAFFIATVPLPGSVAEARNRTPGNLSVPIAGTVDGVAGTLSGSYSISRFARSGNQLVAIGTLTATVSDATGGILRSIVTPLIVPVTPTAVPAVASASEITIAAVCPVLHLELGPLDLDLLGLVVHLDQVVLDITAVSGPGNLLGNLLCAITGLLDPGGSLGRLVLLLNQLLDVLGNL
jgi:hypothetical protein